ncbi:flagellar hook assembly protein FlgD [Dokdonella sp. MW10]|uniref:flagellar hook assembly protein FlgD n=1 Tax=Dokdonella sp. MW10 TaxID=2992926 RepID=UPI003F7F5FB7
MTDLSTITNSMNAAYANAPVSSGSENLTQTDFLRLMIAQLRSQDPSQPMDPTSFFNQISQFSMVSGMQGLQNSFAQLAGAIQSDQSLGAVGLIGRSVLVPSQKGVLGADGLAGAVDVPKDATSVKVRITDSNGKLVREIDLGAPAAGTTRFTWDGLDADGNAMPPGEYSIAATAIVGGTGQAATTFASASVLGLIPATGGGSPMLDLGPLGRVRLSQIHQIV